MSDFFVTFFFPFVFDSLCPTFCCCCPLLFLFCSLVLLLHQVTLSVCFPQSIFLWLLALISAPGDISFSMSELFCYPFPFLFGSLVLHLHQVTFFLYVLLLSPIHFYLVTCFSFCTWWHCFLHVRILLSSLSISLWFLGLTSALGDISFFFLYLLAFTSAPGDIAFCMSVYFFPSIEFSL